MEQELNTVNYWKVPLPLTGNAYFYGRTDSGKSWKMMAIAQGYYEYGYKIWDLFGGKRNEGPFWCFPSEEHKLWNAFIQHVGIMKNEGPKAYPVNLLYPMFKDNLPSKLPQHLPKIKATPFTIPISSITIDDIALVIGDVTANARYVWNVIKKQVGKSGNIADIKHLLNTKLRKHNHLVIVKVFLEPLISAGLLTADNFELNLSFEEESREKETIAVLCHDYIPEEFRWFIMGYFLRQLLAKVMDGKISKKNIGIFREASAFMKIQDKSKQGEDQTQIFRNRVSDVARYARSGLFLFMDTQSPREVKSLVSGQDDLTGINEMPSPSDREELCEQLLRDKRMTRRQVTYLYNIPIQEMVLVARGQKAKLLRRMMPPRNMCWKPTMGTFFNVWKHKINDWTKTRPFIEKIETDIANREKWIQENMAPKKDAGIKEVKIKKDTSFDDDVPIPDEEAEKEIDMMDLL